LPARISSRPVLLSSTVFLALAGVALLRFRAQIVSPAPHTDERVYLEAFEAVANGASPYALHADQLDFYYPPPFAHFGAAALSRVGLGPLVAFFRVANLLGLIATLWIAGRWAALSPPRLLVVGTAYLALAPPALRHGFNSGNLSFAVVGTILVALAAWPRNPLSAGTLLGASSILKPIAPIGLVALFAQRPSREAGRHRLGAAIGLALAAALMLSSPDLDAYLHVPLAIDLWPRRRSVSLYRWMHLAGLPFSPALIFAGVALGVVFWVRRRETSPRLLATIAIAGMTLATPVLWSHSLLLTLPLQTRALAIAARRRRDSSGWSSARKGYELPLVVLGTLALQFADGIGGGVEKLPAVFQLAATTVPVGAPLALALYLSRHDSEEVQLPVQPLGSSE